MDLKAKYGPCTSCKKYVLKKSGSWCMFGADEGDDPSPLTEEDVTQPQPCCDPCVEPGTERPWDE